MTVAVDGLRKTFEGEVRALDGIDLATNEGELLVVVGPSGSGKTTLLRCIAGLERADEGRVEVGGRDVTTLPPGARDVAMVFQEDSLYPHLDVFENIAFGLRARRIRKSEVEERVREAADALRIAGLLARPSHRLSGGERRRVVLARALVRRPRAFLMDEPLGSLDPELRLRARDEVRDLHARAGVAMVYVTHDQTEAMALGARIALLRAGRVEQFGAPRTLYDGPLNTFVARFFGAPSMNLMPGELCGSAAPTAGVRPDRMQLVAPAAGRVAGRVARVEDAGADVLIYVDLAGENVVVRAPHGDLPSKGDEAGLDFADADVYLFDADGWRK